MANKAKTYPDIRIPSPVAQTWLAYKENPLAMAVLWGMLCLLLVVVFGPSLVHYDPQQQDPNALLPRTLKPIFPFRAITNLRISPITSI